MERGDTATEEERLALEDLMRCRIHRTLVADDVGRPQKGRRIKVGNQVLEAPDQIRNHPLV